MKDHELEEAMQLLEGFRTDLDPLLPHQPSEKPESKLRINHHSLKKISATVLVTFLLSGGVFATIMNSSTSIFSRLLPSSLQFGGQAPMVTQTKPSQSNDKPMKNLAKNPFTPDDQSDLKAQKEKPSISIHKEKEKSSSYEEQQVSIPQANLYRSNRSNAKSKREPKQEKHKELNRSIYKKNIDMPKLNRSYLDKKFETRTNYLKDQNQSLIKVIHHGTHHKLQHSQYLKNVTFLKPRKHQEFPQVNLTDNKNLSKSYKDKSLPFTFYLNQHLKCTLMISNSHKHTYPFQLIIESRKNGKKEQIRMEGEFRIRKAKKRTIPTKHLSPNRHSV
ncbi:hypothetical protein [Thermoflavimicrobium daqui]|jgi:hypothetical protein|uniref:Uncharacterized protein n=1 Tax=Thermoflavimicrobium daqui TaxID=2137476 RepID=A0A364K1Z4_9BACL|nr:hypothetical protein [Thermoflavimicrobium daqui]RAL22041.1 hypothetical protein DL897_14685 [Thermoflavimicrobium daqui]